MNPILNHLLWSLSGIVALLIAKYLVIGLRLWDDVLHKGRIEPDSLKRFREPLLGLFG